MADQLLKVFGDNDFSKYFIDEAVAYREKVAETLAKRKELSPEKAEKIKLPPPRNLMLYEPPDEELIHFAPSLSPITNYESGRDTIYYAMFHYRRNEFFEETFPQAWDLLYKIKANKRGEDEHYSKYMFEEFVKDIKPWISLNDKRIQVIKKKDSSNPNETQREILKAGQLYYKVTSLVWQLREVQVMRSIWKELKKAKIRFIPLFDFVMVDGRYESMVKDVTISKWRDHLDPKIKISSHLFHVNQ